MPGQPAGGKAQAEFLIQFAQGAFQRRLARFGAAAGQIPMGRKRDPVVIVAQTGQNPTVADQQQLGTDKA